MRKTNIPKYKDNVEPSRYAEQQTRKQSAKTALAEVRNQERQHSFTPVKVNPYTTILVRKGKDIGKAKKRYEKALL